MKALRISILLLVLVVIAGTAWLDRKGSTSWREPLWVGIYPIAADGNPDSPPYVITRTSQYISTLTPQSFSDIEADGFGDAAQQPRYPQSRAELMAGRRAVSETQAQTPLSLREVVVGPATAREIRWTTR